MENVAKLEHANTLLTEFSNLKDEGNLNKKQEEEQKQPVSHLKIIISNANSRKQSIGDEARDGGSTPGFGEIQQMPQNAFSFALKQPQKEEKKMELKKITKRGSKNLNLTPISLKEVAAHNKEGSAWCIYNGAVIDITNWVNVHPGGKALMLKYAGIDCTADVKKQHPWVNPLSILSENQIGLVKDSDQN